MKLAVEVVSTSSQSLRIPIHKVMTMTETAHQRYLEKLLSKWDS